MPTLPWGERVAMLSINPDAATTGDIARLASELMELAQQDRLKTREINTLVPENRNLIAQRDELRAELLLLADAYDRLLLAYGKPFEWGEVNTEVARDLLAKTSPPNPNAGVVQASPKGRWTMEEAKAEGLKIMEEESGSGSV